MDTELRETYFTTLKQEIAQLIDPNTRMLDEKISQNIDCPLCRSKNERHDQLFIKNGYTFVRCPDCSMIFTNPQVKPSLLEELYRKSKANDIWVDIQESKKEQSWKEGYYQDHIDLLKKHVSPAVPRLLDVGCSTGYFLEVLRNYQPGWQGKGVELSTKAFACAKNKGLNVECKLLTELPETEKFDVFSLFGIIEHLSQPEEILSDIKTYAQKEAYVIAIVPNAYSLYHMFIQQRSISFDGRNHLLYFSDQTFRRLFEDNGFEVVHLDTVLTGMDNIKRQIQWLDPYARNDTDRFVPEKIRHLFDDHKSENFLYEHNLGLRLRVLARYKKDS